jgi:riboflavin synthase
MFSGIVENKSIISKIDIDGSNKHFTFKSPLTADLYIDQSISHNGVCLTVVHIVDETYTVTAIKETLDKTNLDLWKVGDHVNIERSLTTQARIDGHFVQGHVDTTARCTQIQDLDGSWKFVFEIDTSHNVYLVDKGSVCINGVSLTVVRVENGQFEVAIIPYTYQFTNFSNLNVGDYVNIEFDILGKYIIKYLNNLSLLQQQNK